MHFLVFIVDLRQTDDFIEISKNIKKFCLLNNLTNIINILICDKSKDNNL